MWRTVLVPSLPALLLLLKVKLSGAMEFMELDQGKWLIVYVVLYNHLHPLQTVILCETTGEAHQQE